MCFLVELWSTGEPEEAIIASKIAGDSQITDNRDNPKDFAGTAWTYLQSGQFLSAPGPTNEDVKIKVTLETKVHLQNLSFVEDIYCTKFAEGHSYIIPI